MRIQLYLVKLAHIHHVHIPLLSRKTTSTMPEGSLQTTSAITVNKLTRKTESDKDIDNFTTRDQATTGVVPDKKNHDVLGCEY